MAGSVTPGISGFGERSGIAANDPSGYWSGGTRSSNPAPVTVSPTFASPVPHSGVYTIGASARTAAEDRHSVAARSVYMLMYRRCTPASISAAAPACPATSSSMRGSSTTCSTVLDRVASSGGQYWPPVGV